MRARKIKRIGKAAISKFERAHFPAGREIERAVDEGAFEQDALFMDGRRVVAAKCQKPQKVRAYAGFEAARFHPTPMKNFTFELFPQLLQDVPKQFRLGEKSCLQILG